MGVKEILYLELEGLTNTINDYTRDNFIISYSQKLSKLKFPEDKLKNKLNHRKTISLV